MKFFDVANKQIGLSIKFTFGPPFRSLYFNQELVNEFFIDHFGKIVFVDQNYKDLLSTLITDELSLDMIMQKHILVHPNLSTYDNIFSAGDKVLFRINDLSSIPDGEILPKNGEYYMEGWVNSMNNDGTFNVYTNPKSDEGFLVVKKSEIFKFIGSSGQIGWKVCQGIIPDKGDMFFTFCNNREMNGKVFKLKEFTDVDLVKLDDEFGEEIISTKHIISKDSSWKILPITKEDIRDRWFASSTWDFVCMMDNIDDEVKMFNSTLINSSNNKICMPNTSIYKLKTFQDKLILF